MPVVKFSVQAELHEDESIALTGESASLGEWNINKFVKMNSTASSNLYTADVMLEEEATKVSYAYFIYIKNSNKDSLIITRYEPLKYQTRQVGNQPITDVFGTTEQESIFDKGWLTSQTEVRLILSKENEISPISLNNGDKSPKKISCSSLNAILNYCNIISPFNYRTEECSQPVAIPDNHDAVINYIFQIEKVSNLSIKVNMHSNDEIIGHSYICGKMLDLSTGKFSLPIISVQDHKILGCITIKYVVITPLTKIQMTLKDSYSRTWDLPPSVDIGHRGSGNSFTSEFLSDVPENTIASFNKAAESGAKLVEFDVHLTKDKVPIVYHDLTVAMSVNSLHGVEKLLETDIKSLTLAEVRSIKTTHKSRTQSTRPLAFEANYQQMDLFPTLQEVFKKVNPEIGFNIECKWPTFDCKYIWESGMENYGDANEFVDNILTVVFQEAGDRKIHFSCFDADICIMLKRKQNKYPVNLLTNGDTKHYTEILDNRVRYNAMAVGTCLSEGFLALNTLENDVYKNPDIVKKVHDCGLRFVLYGDYVCDNLDKLRDLKVDALIYDRIYNYLK